MSTTTAEHLLWLKANRHNLASLTGTDFRALAAIAPAWNLYSQTRSPGVLVAIKHMVAEMQPKTRHLARELIAYAMDWDDRERLWPEVSP